MIDFLRGKVAHREHDFAVIDVHGVGYRVFCPNPYALPDKPDETTVYIHHHVREDAILLFGFGSREEQSMFRKLIDVTGIGPKVAIGILSGARPEAVVAAIQQENVAFLMKLPGIGKKTAQRIILDLKDKLAAVSAGFDDRALSMQDTGMPAAAGTGAWAEAKEALLALGYTEAEADRAWPSVKAKAKEGDSSDALIKLALQTLYAG
ncbi:Holliday junction branch migration protein RuvA [Paenibacillus hemerocallicola]|uniref:Holliday junction branch migration complex subunit RuvA n=1 Tax=Paenibacillus hemerocallicola TaxID=1172614 RepID=A0A5C4TG77_9BACL|nr:Holliday junction branch migration protein RuvA [Paenibacillus hemerocallicola]TNJ67646.1 Holliday junction branch migration protein RuvA [Paenibacillus hemerocallicola]